MKLPMKRFIGSFDFRELEGPLGLLQGSFRDLLKLLSGSRGSFRIPWGSLRALVGTFGSPLRVR